MGGLINHCPVTQSPPLPLKSGPHCGLLLLAPGFLGICFGSCRVTSAPSLPTYWKGENEAVTPSTLPGSIFRCSVNEALFSNCIQRERGGGGRQVDFTATESALPSREQRSKDARLVFLPGCFLCASVLIIVKWESAVAAFASWSRKTCQPLTHPVSPALSGKDGLLVEFAPWEVNSLAAPLRCHPLWHAIL